MDIEHILEQGDAKELLNILSGKTAVADYYKEYNNDRSIRSTQVGKRLDKEVGTETVAVSRIPIPFQQEIVNNAASFLFGNPINIYDSNEETTKETYTLFKNYWANMRMDALLLKLCKVVKSETEGALVFYIKGNENSEESPALKAKVLSQKNGAIYPFYDDFGNMKAFAWRTTATSGTKTTDTIRVWTQTTEYVFIDKGEGYTSTAEQNVFNKIPVVYLSQDEPDWWAVKDLIDRFEMSFSKFCDTNDYFASPIYKVKGEIYKDANNNNGIKKDSTGKIIQLPISETDKGNLVVGDVEVLSWDRAPESLKLEFETTKGLIYALSGTPDISFDNIKGLGNISGVSLKLMFLASIIKQKNAEGDYREFVDRVFNVIKVGISTINTSQKKQISELQLRFDFANILPENLREKIDLLSNATGGKSIMSQKTALDQNPLVNNTQEDLEHIKKEEGTFFENSVTL